MSTKHLPFSLFTARFSAWLQINCYKRSKTYSTTKTTDGTASGFKYARLWPCQKSVHRKCAEQMFVLTVIVLFVAGMAAIHFDIVSFFDNVSLQKPITFLSNSTLKCN